MTEANGWGRDVFALALAIEMLLWGASQPFAGALADKFGAVRVLVVGALLRRGARLDGVRHLAAGVSSLRRRADRTGPSAVARSRW